MRSEEEYQELKNKYSETRSERDEALRQGAGLGIIALILSLPYLITGGYFIGMAFGKLAQLIGA
jgi:hypothetical protein